ncbi:MAG: DUF302 domain-containing protein [Halioglobus sp.]
MIKPFFRNLLGLAVFTLAVSGCGAPEPISAERYIETDQMVDQIKQNLAGSSRLTKVVDIDHSRLGQQAGSPMPPAKVVIFSDAELETKLIQQNPLVALELPMRVLAFEDTQDSISKVIFNSFDYLAARFQLDAGNAKELGQRYQAGISEAIEGIAASSIASFPSNEMNPDGIITIESPYGFEETIERVNVAINAQDDTMHFGVVDFQANARALGVEIAPSHMILFGGPGPGGKAMVEAATLGLDGFCQKFLIWEDSDGRIKLSFNDLLALADRQGVKTSLPLRVINYRLNKTFSDALADN